MVQSSLLLFSFILSSIFGIFERDLSNVDAQISRNILSLTEIIYPQTKSKNVCELFSAPAPAIITMPRSCLGYIRRNVFYPRIFFDR